LIQSFFACFKSAYVYDITKYSFIDHETFYANGNMTSFFKSDQTYGGYDGMIATNAYHYYGLCYNFMKIKECTGWEPFKQTFRYFNSLASQSVPTTNMGKLNLFIIKLRDYSGQNVIGMLTTQEKNIYATKFGGAIEYYTGTLYTDDHSNYVSSGTFMTLGTPIDGSIEYAGDEDWFRFTTTNAGTYTITTSDYSPSSFFMYLHKTDTISYIPAIETTFLDDGVTVFKFDLPAETAYSVRIYPYGSSGDYTVCVDGVKPLNETGGKTHGKKRAKQAGRNKNRAGKRIADGRKKYARHRANRRKIGNCP